MDARSEIREFLTSRRARITPEQSGLRTYGGNRRVPGLRREEVALLAEVGSKSEESLSLLASWAATVDQAETATLTDR